MFATFAIGMTEVVVLLVIALLLFGKRFPDIARSIEVEPWWTFGRK